MDVKLQTARQGGLSLLRDLLRSGLPRNSGKRLSQGVGLGLPQQAHPLDRGRRSRCSLRQHHLMIQTLRSSSVTWREPGAEGGCSSWSEEIGWAWRGKTEGLEVCSIVVCLEGRSPRRGPRQWGRRLWGVSIGPRWSEKGKRGKSALKEKPTLTY